MALPKLNAADHERTAHLTTNKAAEVLGVSHGAVKRLRERLGVGNTDSRITIKRDRQADWAETFDMTYKAAASHLGTSVKYVQWIRSRFDPPELDRMAQYNTERACSAPRAAAALEHLRALPAETSPTPAPKAKRLPAAKPVAKPVTESAAVAPTTTSNAEFREKYAALLARYEKALEEDIGLTILVAEAAGRAMSYRRRRRGLPVPVRPDGVAADAL